MFPLRCLSILLLSVVFIHCDEETTETLIEMKDDKLSDEETITTTEWMEENGENEEENLFLAYFNRFWG